MSDTNETAASDSSAAFLSLPILFDDWEADGVWRRTVKRASSVAELLETWDIDDEAETSAMAQVLRHLRNAMLQIEDLKSRPCVHDAAKKWLESGDQ